MTWRLPRTVLAGLALVSVVFFVRPAQAYAWMIRDGYTTCVTCHADPSGAGLLTPYGRAQSEILLSVQRRGPEDEPSRFSRSLFGLYEEADTFLFSPAVRQAYFVTDASQGPASTRGILMQAEVRAQVRVGRLRVNGSVGVVPSGGQLATLAPDAPVQILSREHWVGVDLGEERDILLRVGRINVPYGLRGNEHTAWIRQTLRTDIAFHQQHGVALARSSPTYRTEVMAILGNYQVPSDVYRERGYAGYYERVLAPGTTLGASTQLTHAEGDLFRSRRQPITRHSYGLFARHVLRPSVVLLAQADLLARHPQRSETELGAATFLQADLQLVHGVHVLPALELQQVRFDRGAASYGAWLSGVVFPAAHFEVRLDLIGRSVDTGGGRVGSLSSLAQVHVYF